VLHSGKRVGGMRWAELDVIERVRMLREANDPAKSRNLQFTKHKWISCVALGYSEDEVSSCDW
jgi:hypothetical protein